MINVKVRSVIPVYQRNYAWEENNCKQLFDDLVKIIEQDRKTHFFGCLFTANHIPPNGTSERNLIIIDGQQRLTTVSLLLLAMHRLLEEGIVKSETKNLANEIFYDYLIDAQHIRDGEEKPIKLQLVQNNHETYQQLFDAPTEADPSSNLTKNYRYFLNRLQRQELNVDQVFKAISRLEFMSITLEDQDNPQLIFESLNSTGRNLTEGDKIRNYVLMGLSPEKQELICNKYWNPIEVHANDVSAFVRDYLSVKLPKIPKEKEVYARFKEYVERESRETISIALLSEMLDYARRYHTLLVGGSENRALNSCIERLNQLETTVTRPFFLEVLRLRDEEKLTADQVVEIFRTTENFIFRRMICEDLESNVLNSLFANLHKGILKFDGTDENYVEKLKYSLLIKSGSSRFPSDEEFKQAFSERPVYSMNNKIVYILERLENFDTKEKTDVYRRCKKNAHNALTIEHIMPQNLTEAWRKELGPDYEQIHREWLHRIANLTLTAYNSKYSNKSFNEKKTVEQRGFANSGIRMNATWIAKKDKWTLEELQERDRFLTDMALKIWSAPTTDYRPKEKQLDSCSLCDEEELTKRKIAKISFKGVEQPVKNWPDILERVVRTLYEDNPSVILQLAQAQDAPGVRFLLTNQGALSSKDCKEISPQVFLRTKSSPQAKRKFLKELLAQYGEDEDALVFYLQDETPKDEE